MQNRENTCYACAVLHILHYIDLGRYLQPGQTPQEENLKNLLMAIFTPIRATNTFDLIPVVMTLNLCLPPQEMFQIGRQGCAGEFLDLLLLSLNIDPYISSFIEVGICPVCHTPQTSSFNTRSQYLLLLPQPDTPSQPVDLHTEVTSVLQAQYLTLTCQTTDCTRLNCRIGTRVHCTEQQVTIYWVGRNLTGSGVKCLVQVLEPAPSRDRWNGKECVAIIAHTGRSSAGGHWFTFLKSNGVWWRVDTNYHRIFRQDPFRSQLLSTNQPVGSDFTLDIFFFK